MMPVHRIGAAAAAVALLGAAAPPASAATGLGPVHGTFPARELVLTLPARAALDARSVRVLENGRAVGQLRVIPAERAPQHTFGFVLALDASNSMQGRPEAAALSAVKAFADEKTAAAALGLVVFNSDVRTILEPSTSAPAITSAVISRPALAEGTRMRDAVARAIASLSHSRVSAGAVVVLSDGADIGSRTSAADLVRLARAAGIRIFTVGLSSPQFDPGALRALAAATGGRYVAATDAAALVPIYRELGRSLASEYLIRYRSAVSPGTAVTVAVAVPELGLVQTASYRLPSAAGAVYREPWTERFWRSPAGVATTILVVAALAAVAAVAARRALRPRVGSRLAKYGMRRRVARADAADGRRVAQLAARALARSDRFQRFASDVEIARTPFTAVTAVTATTGAVAAIVLAAALSGEILVILLAVAPPLAVRAYVQRRLRLVRARFEDDLPDNIQMLASALRAGHGLATGLVIVAANAVEPARSEFEHALADQRLGAELDDALATIAERMRSSDLDQVALVTALHRETGGNTAEVLERVHDSLRERAELRRTVRSLTAEGRMTRWLLSALPVCLIGVILLINRSYLSPLLDTGGGRLLLALAAVMIVAGSLVIKRIVEIEV